MRKNEKIIYWVKKNELDTPCLIIDINTLKYNLNYMKEHAIKNNIQVRPHCKTHKCSELAKLQIEYGAIGVSVAKVSEAITLINKGISNILITSPVISKNKILQLLLCIKKAPETIVVVDNEENLIDLNLAGESINQQINVLIDLDSGIGRTGINPSRALDFGLKINKYKWLNLVGVQCYAGNLQHIKSFNERKKLSLQIMQNASETVQTLRRNGLQCLILTGTGTGTYDIDVEATEITEIQPGSYAVMDVEYMNIGSKFNNNSFNTFKQSMSLLTTVISSNRDEHVTVDAGTKSIYIDIMHKPEIISHTGLQYSWGGFGDEHGKITSNHQTSLPKIKEVLELIVPHCDPTINLYDNFFIIDKGVVVDVWQIDLRGKSQ